MRPSGFVRTYFNNTYTLSLSHIYRIQWKIFRLDIVWDVYVENRVKNTTCKNQLIYCFVWKSFLPLQSWRSKLSCIVACSTYGTFALNRVMGGGGGGTGFSVTRHSPFFRSVFGNLPKHLWYFGNWYFNGDGICVIFLLVNGKGVFFHGNPVFVKILANL